MMTSPMLPEEHKHILDGVEPYTLVPFQAEDVEWCLQKHKHMLLYDRGLGKTVVATMRDIRAGVGTKLIICPGNAVNTWRYIALDWIRHYYPSYDVDVFLIEGKPLERKRIWDELLKKERTKQFRVFIVKYGTYLADIKNGTISLLHFKNIDQWDWDEAHRLRNRNSKVFTLSGKFFRYHKYFSLLTGTPSSRGSQDFWTMLHMCNPSLFSSYWKFVDTFCEQYEGYYGKEIIGQRNQDQFQRYLNMYARIRTRDDPAIAGQLPESTRTPIFVRMDADQERIYYELEANKLAWVNGELILGGLSMELVMRFRQLLVCPRILNPVLSLGAAFNSFLETMEDSSPDERHTVVFCPFKSPFPYFAEALQKLKIPVTMLHGGITPDEQRERIESWRANKGVLLNTIAYAESYSLEPAKQSWFIGYEWDPNQNMQAEDRLKRLTTRYPVNHNYFRYEGTVDDNLAYTVNWKHEAVSSIMSHKNRLILPS
jgi:SNF2 family DNA or RNA helicase